jgi:hypothetical protein
MSSNEEWLWNIITSVGNPIKVTKPIFLNWGIHKIDIKTIEIYKIFVSKYVPYDFTCTFLSFTCFKIERYLESVVVDEIQLSFQLFGKKPYQLQTEGIGMIYIHIGR